MNSDYEMICRRVAAVPGRPFEFPDGYNAYFGTLRMSAPEILFTPSRFMPLDVSLVSIVAFVLYEVTDSLDIAVH